MAKKQSILILITFLAVSLTVNCGKKEEKAPETSTTTESTSTNSSKAAELYAQCAACHGDQGLGDGAAGAQLKPAPRNFKSATAEWKNGKTVEGITKTLKEGITGTSMAAYSYLSDEDINTLANYVLELGK
jgi:mono/diheme cytochrome c family protein